MKINLTGYEKYQSYVQKTKGGEKPTGKSFAQSLAARADTVTLSAEASARKVAGGFAADIASELDGAAGAQRVQELREAVQAGSYSVDAADVADAMLNLKV